MLSYAPLQGDLCPWLMARVLVREVVAFLAELYVDDPGGFVNDGGGWYTIHILKVPRPKGIFCRHPEIRITEHGLSWPRGVGWGATNIQDGSFNWPPLNFPSTKSLYNC